MRPRPLSGSRPIWRLSAPPSARTPARARARRASARARWVSQRNVRASADHPEPFGLSQLPRARPAPHESLDVFAAASARDRER